MLTRDTQASGSGGDGKELAAAQKRISVLENKSSILQKTIQDVDAQLTEAKKQRDEFERKAGAFQLLLRSFFESKTRSIGCL